MKNMKAKTMKTLHSLVAGLRPSSSILARWIAFPLFCVGAGLTLVQPCAGAPFQFEPTGSLHTARHAHRDVAAQRQGARRRRLTSTPRRSREGGTLRPASGTWTTTGSLATARFGHTATLLPNGKVLVAGGLHQLHALASAELYDPATGKWTATGSLVTARSHHTATLLPNGKVLVAGGLATAACSRERGTLRPSERDLDGDRQPRHRTLLSHGDVAARRQGARLRRKAGIEASSCERGTLRSGERNLDDHRQPHHPRYLHTATLLPNGKVLVAGGIDISGSASASAELYDPASGTWTATGSLATDAITTWRPCCPTARCSSPADMT